VLVLATTSSAFAKEPELPLVASVQVQGQRYLSEETYLFYISTKVGDRLDTLRLRSDFRRLWDTGFLDDLALDVSDGDAGAVVTFIVDERRRVQVVDYRGSKDLKPSDIEDELEERDAKLRIDGFYDPKAANKVEQIIAELLAEKGYRFGTVRHEVKVVSGSALHVSFVIDDGAKAKVRSVDFDGNHAFADGTLRRRMKIKQPSLLGLTWLRGNTIFSDEKWKEDELAIRNFYLDHGYVDARVGTPTLTYTDRTPEKPDAGQEIKVSIPIEEGTRYRVGKVSFDGLTLFAEDWVRSLIALEEGQYYEDSKVRKAIETLQKAYGKLGYFQFTGYPERAVDPSTGVVDVTLRLDEDERYFVGRIAFVGNDMTRDKVVRRALFLNEGDPLNTEFLELSIKRVNQLGYFKPQEKMPHLAPGQDEHSVDVTFELEEQNRNQVAIGGGFSELDGAYVNLNFQTANFLGRGEALNLAVQTGTRSTNHRISFTTPYAFDRPITAGFDLYFNRATYLTSGTFVGFGQQTQGVGLTLGMPVGRFSRALLSYSFQIVDVYEVEATTVSSALTGVVADDLIESPTATQRFDLEAVGGAERRFESTVSPSWVRDTVDDPFLPRSGTRSSATFHVMGGLLGGSVDLLRPTVESIAYKPLRKWLALGVRGQFGFVQPYGSTTEIPYYRRYFLGGETQIRGYDLRTVGPYDTDTQTGVGGNKFMLFNAELYLDAVRPLRLLAFFDAGQAAREGEGLYWKTMSTSAGVEARMLVPVLNVPVRLIYAWNLNRDYFQPARTLKFAVGTTF
jgi:outer membrane protein insertion porin family